MNEDLPEIGFKEKKKEKKGFLPWISRRMGFGGRSSMGSLPQSAANFGNLGAGAGKMGASAAGIRGLLAGKAGMLVTAAMVAVATGVYLSHNGPAPMKKISSSSSGSASAPENYVPAILRDQAHNKGSSLDMFKATNRNAGLSFEEAEAKKGWVPPEQEPPPQEEEQPAPQDNMASGMMSKLSIGALSGSLGSGDSKFSGMGGFGNKFGQGPKVGGAGVGSGFQALPGFAERQKLLAMKGAAKPVFSNAKGAKRGTFGKGAFSQAKGVKFTQRSYSGTNVDSTRSTQDKAWEGSTAGNGGASATGTGIGDGGAGTQGGGVLTSPSLDNSRISGNMGSIDDPTVDEPEDKKDVSPWKNLTTIAMMLIMISAILSTIGAKLVEMGGIPKIIGIIVCGFAMMLAGVATTMGTLIMRMHGQAMLGGIYVTGGGVAMAAAVMAMTGATLGPVNAMWMAAIAGVISLLGSMAGGSIGKTN